MKIYSLLTLLACLSFMHSMAQVPQSIPYQSVVRNGSGALLTNQPVSMRFSIHDSILQGTIVYQETHNTTTSNGGMVILNIGQGTPVTGIFSAINWGMNSKFMQVELDTIGVGTNYIDLGTQQLMSVPYALYAKTAGSISLPPGASHGQVLTFCDGNYVWTNGGICPASVATIDCAGATNTGLLNVNNPASNVSCTITYTGGNGGAYPTQTVSSTGITGLTATLSAGSLNNGNGSLTFLISGIPSNSGTASFLVNIGGQSCTLNYNVLQPPQPAYPAGSVFCIGTPTLVVDVTNPITGKTWMDRNLGATQVATSSTDTVSYGDFYQWGRGSDGHQCRNSLITGMFNSSDLPGNVGFILGNMNADWRTPQNDNLWQGVSGLNNPCPNGYRIPTSSEWNNEKSTWFSSDIVGAMNSNLSLPIAGLRSYGDGFVVNVNTGYYWSSNVGYGIYSFGLSIGSNYSYVDFHGRAHGFSVRCIKN